MIPRSIYVASRASVLARGRMWRQLRDEGGHPIVSSWIDEDGPGQTASMSDLWARIQLEVGRSDLLVLYVEPSDLPLKGAFIEAGMALAMGKPVRLVAAGFHPGEERPQLGSWICHPSVTLWGSVVEALRSPLSSTPPVISCFREGDKFVTPKGTQICVVSVDEEQMQIRVRTEGSSRSFEDSGTIERFQEMAKNHGWKVG